MKEQITVEEDTTFDSITCLHEYGLNPDSREIWLIPNEWLVMDQDDPEPGVEWTMAGVFLKNLNMLIQEDQEAPILIHMKTCGGMWEEGIAIFDAINTCPCPVTILSYTHARSMSSLIFSAANKRVMMPHSTFMFHEGEMHYGGTVKQFMTAQEQLTKSGQEMMDIYTHVMRRDSRKWKGKSVKQCEDWIKEQMRYKEDVYLNPEEAIREGFADEIFSGDWSGLTKYTNKQLERFVC